MSMDFSFSFRTETSAFEEPIKCSPMRWGYPPFVTSWGLSSKLKVVRVASRLGRYGSVSTANLLAASSKCCCVAASGVGVAGNSFAGGSRKARPVCQQKQCHRWLGAARELFAQFAQR